MLCSKGGGWLVLIIGLITTIYGIANTIILFLSMKAKGEIRKNLVVFSGVINGLLFITWLISSLDYGGLQQVEAPAIILLAIIGISNYFAVRQNTK